MPATKVVHLPLATYEAVRKLAGDESMHVVIAEAIEKLRRERFFDEVDADYERLRADHVLWAHEMEERALLEDTLMDGLEDEPPYPMEARS
jgi:hypothetical protein